LALNCGVLLAYLPTPDPPTVAACEEDGNERGGSRGEGDDGDDGHDGVAPLCVHGVAAPPPLPMTSASMVCLISDAFDGEVRFDLADVPPPGHVGAEKGNWGAYARGAAWAIRAWLAAGPHPTMTRPLACSPPRPLVRQVPYTLNSKLQTVDPKP